MSESETHSTTEFRIANLLKKIKMQKFILLFIMIWCPIESNNESFPVSVPNSLDSNKNLKLPNRESDEIEAVKKALNSIADDDSDENIEISLNIKSRIIPLLIEATFNGTESLEESTSKDKERRIDPNFGEHKLSQNNSKEIGRTIRKVENEGRESYQSSRDRTFPFNFKTCRTRDGRHLPPDVFAWDTCAHCYLFELGKKYHREPPWGVKMRSHDLGFTVAEFLVLINVTDQQHEIEANVSNDDLFLSVQHEKFQTQWKQCCLSAMRCCETMLLDEHKFETNVTSYCPRTWDGWQCWKDTLPDSEAYEPCPSYSYIETSPACIKMARKRCDESGKWFRREDGREKTDYSTCGVLPNIKIRIYCHMAAVTLSILALIPALFIFCWFRQLRVHRITLHKHLFASLLLEAILTFTFRFLELFGGSLLKANPTWCIALKVIRIYARQTNYTWYLCEGFYLHQLLVSAFAKPINMAVFYIIGWGFPIIPVVLYTVFRASWYENGHCWSMPIQGIEWLIYVPPLLALMVNLFFIFNVMRILLSKVRNKNDFEPYHFRMAVRATLMVVPLFGLQYAITIYRPTGQTCSWHDFYHIANNIIDGSTGFIVAIIYCFANSEVRNLLLRSWRRLKDKHDAPTLRELYGSLMRSRSMSTVQTTLVESHSTAPRRTSSYISMNAVTSNLIMNNKNLKSFPISEVLRKTRSSYPSTNENRHLETFLSVPANLATQEVKVDDYTKSPVEPNCIDSQNIYYIDEDVEDDKSECSRNWTPLYGDDFN